MSRPLPRILLAAALGCAVVGCAGPPPVPAGGDALDEWLSRREPTPTSGLPAEVSRAPARDAAADLVLAAMNFIDRPYRNGGQSAETGFDCSGFTRHVFGQALGIELPRSADEQAHDRALSRVSRHALRPGDLVFFNTLRRTFSHVGIYVGDGRFIHAPRSGAQVRVESLAADYWSRRFTGARRVAALGETATP
jgi:cell wall-associated NlpC family hydrolase